MFEAAEFQAEVAKVQQRLGRLCSELDPDAIPLPEVTSVWSALDAIERMAAGAKCRMARRVEESKTWQRRGERTAAEFLGRRSGTTTGRARSALETSKRLAQLPDTDQAVARGELSDQEAEAIAGAASADPSAEQRLLELAKGGDLRRLREECARVRARAEDEAERAERLHRQRCLRTWSGNDGSWNLVVRNTPEVGAELEAALAPLKEAIFNAARRQGRQEPGEAYGADALAEIVRRAVAADDERRGPTGASTGRGVGGSGVGRPASATEPIVDDEDDESSPDGGGANGVDGVDGGDDDADADADVDGGDDDAGADADVDGGGEPATPTRSRRPDTRVIVLISYEALKRGLAQAGETCEIAGVGPVSVATARSLMVDAFGAAIVTNGVDVFSVAHLGRSVTAYQRSALEARGYHCEVPGCGATRALEIDHIADWHLTWRTQLDQLCWLCRRHHLDKTHRGARLLGPPGDRRWVTRDRAGPGEEAVPGSAARGDPSEPSQDEGAVGPTAPRFFGDPSAA